MIKNKTCTNTNETHLQYLMNYIIDSNVHTVLFDCGHIYQFVFLRDVRFNAEIEEFSVKYILASSFHILE